MCAQWHIFLVKEAEYCIKILFILLAKLCYNGSSLAGKQAGHDCCSLTISEVGQ